MKTVLFTILMAIGAFAYANGQDIDERPCSGYAVCSCAVIWIQTPMTEQVSMMCRAVWTPEAYQQYNSVWLEAEVRPSLRPPVEYTKVKSVVPDVGAFIFAGQVDICPPNGFYGAEGDFRLYKPGGAYTAASRSAAYFVP